MQCQYKTLLLAKLNVARHDYLIMAEPADWDLYDPEPELLLHQEGAFGHDIVVGELYRIHNEQQLAVAEEQLAGIRARRQQGQRLGRRALSRLSLEEKCALEDVGAYASQAYIDARTVGYGIDECREFAKKIPEDLRASFEEVFDPDLPAIFRWPREGVSLDEQVSPRNHQRVHLASWLGGLASDAQIVNFLQWNQYKLDKANKDPDIRAHIVTNRHWFRQAVFEAITEHGTLPSSRRASIAHYMASNVPIILADPFDTVAKGREAYYKVGGSIYVGVHAIRQSMKSGAMDNVLWHELAHATLGTIDEYMWLDEALTEHITQVLLRGDPGKFYPPERTKDSGIYVEERTLLAAIMRAGKKTVPARMAINAYMYDKDAAPVRRAFEQRLNEAWAGGYDTAAWPGILEAVTAHVEQEKRRFEKEGLSEGTAQSEACRAVTDTLLSL